MLIKHFFVILSEAKDLYGEILHFVQNDIYAAFATQNGISTNERGVKDSTFRIILGESSSKPYANVVKRKKARQHWILC